MPFSHTVVHVEASGVAATLVLAPFPDCRQFLHVVERDEAILERFEFLQYHLGHLGSSSVLIADVTRKIRCVDGHVEHFFRGKK